MLFFKTKRHPIVDTTWMAWNDKLSKNIQRYGGRFFKRGANLCIAYTSTPTSDEQRGRSSAWWHRASTTLEAPKTNTIENQEQGLPN